MVDVWGACSNFLAREEHRYRLQALCMRVQVLGKRMLTILEQKARVHSKAQVCMSQSRVQTGRQV